MELDMNSIVKINGKSMNMAEFAERFGLDLLNPALVIATANVLKRQGKLLISDNRSKDEVMLDNAMEEHAFQQVVANMDEEEQAHFQRKRQAQLAENDIQSFALSFMTSVSATKFDIWVKSLGVENTQMLSDTNTGAIKLVIRNVTPHELVKITNKYKAENAINTGMVATNKAVTGATNAVNYGLTNVVAPTAKIVGEAGMNLGKGLFHTGVKTIAGLINSGAKAVVETRVALTTDPDCLRATSQLLDVKNTLKQQVNKKMNNSNFGNGIEML